MCACAMLSSCGLDLTRLDGSLEVVLLGLADAAQALELVIERDGRRDGFEFSTDERLGVESVPVGRSYVQVRMRAPDERVSNRPLVQIFAGELTCVGLRMVARPDGDTDGDGVSDVDDDCPFVASAQQVDTDRDGIGDACDVCQARNDPEQLDFDGDGYGDACDPDVDGDGVLNVRDDCPRDPSGDVDADGDGICDSVDNCLDRANPTQADCDRDSVGDACDLDIDGDGVANARDVCPFTVDPEQIDSNGDGVGDACVADPVTCRSQVP